MLTTEQARTLKSGDVLHVEGLGARPCDSKNGPVRWKVNGQVKTWKRSPDRVEVPLKHGLYTYDRIVIREGFNNSGLRYHLEDECPVFAPRTVPEGARRCAPASLTTIRLSTT